MTSQSMRRAAMSHSLTIDVPEDVFSNLIRLALQEGKTPETLARDLNSRGIQDQESDPLLRGSERSDPTCRMPPNATIRGDAPGSEAGALGARELLPAR